MKSFRLIAALLLPGLFAAMPSHAQDKPFSPEQKKAIEQIVRDYILEHPEILPEAINVLRQRDTEKRIAAVMPELKPGPAVIEAGNPKGNVTMVEFFDFRCPYCKSSYEDVKRLLDKDKNLRLLFVFFPILDQPGESVSMDFARAGAAAARQGKYMAFHHAAFTQNKRVTNRDEIYAVAEQAGLDIDKLKADMADPEIIKNINDNVDIGRFLQLSGTPAYIVNNQILAGAVGYDAIADAVAQARPGKK